ncbi:hypothetical protein BDR06DRAFT_21241 [Suillus hirtellus]|nr:hypothetical protein BDR06DRAFT_21241 [Suillus hirtellus]
MHHLHPSFAPIVTLSIPVFLQRTRSTTSIPFCVYRIHSILFFTLSYSLNSLSTIWFVVGRFLHSLSRTPSCEPLPCAFTLPFICTLSAHPSSSLLQQSLYHIELCLQLHLQSERLNGCFQYTGGALFLARTESALDCLRRDVHQNRAEVHISCTAKDHSKYPRRRLGADRYYKKLGCQLL